MIRAFAKLKQLSVNYIVADNDDKSNRKWLWYIWIHNCLKNSRNFQQNCNFLLNSIYCKIQFSKIQIACHKMLSFIWISRSFIRLKWIKYRFLNKKWKLFNICLFFQWFCYFLKVPVFMQRKEPFCVTFYPWIFFEKSNQGKMIANFHEIVNFHFFYGWKMEIARLNWVSCTEKATEYPP